MFFFSSRFVAQICCRRCCSTLTQTLFANAEIKIWKKVFHQFFFIWAFPPIRQSCCCWDELQFLWGNWKILSRRVFPLFFRWCERARVSGEWKITHVWEISRHISLLETFMFRSCCCGSYVRALRSSLKQIRVQTEHHHVHMKVNWVENSRKFLR